MCRNGTGMTEYVPSYAVADVLAEPHDPQLAGVKLVGFIGDPEGHVAEVVQRS